MWRDLRVGDIVWIKKGSEVPADVVQLSSSEEVCVVCVCCAALVELGGVCVCVCVYVCVCVCVCACVCVSLSLRSLLMLCSSHLVRRCVRVRVCVVCVSLSLSHEMMVE